MENYSTGDSGIRSLSGFAYQIRVFVYYLSELKENMQIEFETLEDVNMKINPNAIDDYIGKIKYKEKNHAIQVKRTKIDNSSAKKILYNWFLIEKSSNYIEKYILFTDKTYNNSGEVFNTTPEELFKTINESESIASALVSKVKKLFDENFEDFEFTYNSIKGKYKFESFSEIDKKIIDSFSYIFRKAGVMEITYITRVTELLNYITVEILECANKRKSFSLTYENFIFKIEEICQRINDKQSIPNYSMFKKINKIDLNDLEISNSREYHQLNSCKMPKPMLEKHLIYKLYYEHFKYLSMENNKLDIIDNIEDLTFENYESVLWELSIENNDTPSNRFMHTHKKDNTYAPNEQIKSGSSIHLTKDDTDPELKISWEDD